MRILILILIFITAQLWKCAYAQQPTGTKSIINVKAKQLNDSALSVIYHVQNYKVAIDLLEKALQIDSNFSAALVNKYSFEIELKQYYKAIITAKKLTELNPDVPEYWFSVGLAYLLSEDSISSQNYFQKASDIYGRRLDTMNKENVTYKTTLANQAAMFIYAGNPQKSYVIFKILYDSATDDLEKDLYSHYMNKSRKEIIDEMLHAKPDTTYTTTETPMDADTIQYYSRSDAKKNSIKDGFYLLKKDYTKSNGFKLQNGDDCYYLAKNIMVTFENIDTVFKKYDNRDHRYVLEFVFNNKGAKDLADITRKSFNNNFGIIISGKLISAPRLNGSIDSGKMELSGLFTASDIDELLKQIKIKN